MIKYLGSKRLLLPSILESVYAALPGGRGTVLDLFSGTARVGHALKGAGFAVIANDHLAYAHVLARCYVEADAEDVGAEAAELLGELGARPPKAGWFTELYAHRSRYLHPENAARIEAIREAIESLNARPLVRAVLLVSLLEAADRVDSTVGVQMAYLKRWAPRALKPLELRLPALLPRARSGPGRALCLDACDAASIEADLVYIDPPYNQHSYLGNYHVWETLVRWDQPEVYGVACKRIDCRERRSDFNRKSRCRAALNDVLSRIRAPKILVSFSDEGYIARDELETMLSSLGVCTVVEHPYRRYMGARIGIYNPRGERVGRVGALSNTEFLFLVERATGATGGGPLDKQPLDIHPTMRRP